MILIMYDFYTPFFFFFLTLSIGYNLKRGESKISEYESI